MRLPYINLRWVLATVVVLVVAAGAAGGWLWWNGRPDKLWDSANASYRQGETLRGVGSPQPAKPSDADKDKAKTAYERARGEVKLFTDRAPQGDPRVPLAHVLKFKILWALAGLKPDEQANLQAEAFREGDVAAQMAPDNIEAQAIVVSRYFRASDFEGAYPAARTLIDNLPPDNQPVDLDNFNDYVVGAYYVVALKDLKNNHPDDALKDLDAGLAREKPGPGGRREQRWRAVLVEVQALQKKVEMAGQDSKAARPADDRLKAVLARAVERARGELNETVPGTDGKPDMPRVTTLSLTNTVGLIDVLLAAVVKADSHQAVSERTQLMLEVCEKMAGTPGAPSFVYQGAVRGSSRLIFLNGALPAAIRLGPKEAAQVQGRTVAINDTVLKNGGPIDPSAYLEMSRTAQSQNDKARALEMAKRGLKVAAEQHVPAGDNRVVALEAQAAWLLLLDRKVKEAEEYLALIARQQQLADDVAYMRGLGAVLDARLDEGVQQLS
ncbi:MAG TPA: hypothetical protein VFW33_12610, partial [Gemmataceae bacterium]|nr:hypothetical protein [Gemmataceae bacterium]